MSGSKAWEAGVADVFLSYNREDQPVAKRIADALALEGVAVWLDIALRAGENYDEVTEETLRKAKAVVVLWSEKSVKSRWVRAEATLGARKNALVPVMIEPCDRPIMFELIQTADLSNWTDDRTDPNWRAFVEDIQRHIAEANAAAAKAAGAPPPKAQKQKKIKPPKPPKKKGGGGAGSFLVILVLLAIIGAGGWFAYNNYPALLAMVTAPAEEPPAPEPVAAPIEEAVIEAPPARDFTDCELCPQMLRIPGGEFQMGAAPGEAGAQPWEGPAHAATAPAFAISTTEVTFAQWDYCVADGGCLGYAPPDRGGRGARPVIFVSWADAQAYVQWLSRKTGRAYRLPSEVEWEFAARGGSADAFWWGPRFEQASAVRGASTQEVTALPANGLGLAGIGGNVGEWVQDCYSNAFAELPTNGMPSDSARCAFRVVRDGAFNDAPAELRVAHRVRYAPATRASTIGFRVASAP
jgi:formylglycine-generating enzyme required for sulfatase activity